MAVEGKVVTRLLQLDSDAVFWAFRHLIVTMIIVLIEMFVAVLITVLITVFITVLVVTMRMCARRYALIAFLSLHRESHESALKMPTHTHCEDLGITTGIGQSIQGAFVLFMFVVLTMVVFCMVFVVFMLFLLMQRRR